MNIPKEAQELFNKANEHSDNREYEKALGYLNRALEIEPNYAEAMITLGYIHYKLDYKEMTEEEVFNLSKKALDLNPNYMGIDFKHKKDKDILKIIYEILKNAEDLEDNGNFDEAKREYQKAFRLKQVGLSDSEEKNQMDEVIFSRQSGQLDRFIKKREENIEKERLERGITFIGDPDSFSYKDYPSWWKKILEKDMNRLDQIKEQIEYDLFSKSLSDIMEILHNAELYGYSNTLIENLVQYMNHCQENLHKDISIEERFHKKNISKVIKILKEEKESKSIESYIKKIDKENKKAQTAFEKKEFEKSVKIWENSLVKLKNIKMKAKNMNLGTLHMKTNPKLIKGINNLIGNLMVKIQNAKILGGEQDIYQALLWFSEKYPRITLRDLADRTKINKKEVEIIIKRFIKNKVFSAKYDNTSKSIEFLSVMKEIDTLMETFGEWSKNGKNKKN